jgi:hypothetical protein
VSSLPRKIVGALGIGLSGDLAIGQVEDEVDIMLDDSEVETS